MCAQYETENDVKRLERLYRVKIDRTFIYTSHVYPKYVAPVILDKGSGPLITPMNFGLYKNISIMNKKTGLWEQKSKWLHNIQSESITKRMFTKTFRTKRCLVPMLEFYEWIEVAGKKKLMRFIPKDREILTAAGIWGEYDEPKMGKGICFSVVTKEPYGFVKEAGHDRSPLFLKEEYLKSWLSPEELDEETVKSMMEDYAEVEFKMAASG